MKGISAVMQEVASFVIPGAAPSGVKKGSDDFAGYMDLGAAGTASDGGRGFKAQGAAKPVKAASAAVKPDKTASSNLDGAVKAKEAAPAQPDIKEKALAVDDAIKDVVKGVLDIDGDTLERALEALGLVPTDLLDMANLQKLVLFVGGYADASDLLTSESLFADMKDIAQAFEQIDWEGLTGMSKDDFLKALDEALGKSDAPLLTQEAPEADDGVAPLEKEAEVTVEYVSDDARDAAAQPEKKPEKGTAEVVTQQKDVKEGVAYQEKEASPKVKGAEADAMQAGAKKQQSDGEGVLTSFGDEAQAAQKEARPEGGAVISLADFAGSLSKAAADVSKPVFAQQADVQQMLDILNQVVSRIKVTLGEQTSSMQLQLHPESLGKVLVSVTSNSGVMTANFTVQTEEAREALQSQMMSLKEALESRSLKVDAVEVEVSDFAFSQSSQSDMQDGKKFENGDGKRMRFSFDEEDEAEGGGEAKSVKGPYFGTGSSIDYTA